MKDIIVDKSAAGWVTLDPCSGLFEVSVWVDGNIRTVLTINDETAAMRKLAEYEDRLECMMHMGLL